MAQSHPVRAHALALLAPCPLRLTSALSPRRSDDLPVALFDEPALVRVPRTAHVLPAAPLANNPCPCPLRHLRGLVSPGSAPALPVSRLPLPPWQVRLGDPQAASAALSDAVRSDAALPDAAAYCDAPPPLRPGALTLPAARGRPCAATIAHTPSLGAFSLICVPSTPPGRCRQHRFMRASPLRRVVAGGPCVYRVLYVSYARRGVTVRDNGINVLN